MGDENTARKITPDAPALCGKCGWFRFTQQSQFYKTCTAPCKPEWTGGVCTVFKGAPGQFLKPGGKLSATHQHYGDDAVEIVVSYKDTTPGQFEAAQKSKGIPPDIYTIAPESAQTNFNI